jgi:hypothetical protein
MDLGFGSVQKMFVLRDPQSLSMTSMRGTRYFRKPSLGMAINPWDLAKHGGFNRRFLKLTKIILGRWPEIKIACLIFDYVNK